MTNPAPNQPHYSLEDAIIQHQEYNHLIEVRDSVKEQINDILLDYADAFIFKYDQQPLTLPDSVTEAALFFSNYVANGFAIFLEAYHRMQDGTEE